MLTAIAIIPSTPVLVPQLSGAATHELVDLHQAVCAAAAALPERWLVIGVGADDDVVSCEHTGTFAGYGADERIALSPWADHFAELPLCALIAGWVRGVAQPRASADVRVFATDHDADGAVRHGRALRAEIDRTADPVGVVVVADGAHTLTAAAPGGFDPASADVQAALDDALAGGDVAALGRLPESVTGRVAWQVLAGLAEPGPRSAKELHRGAPFGVGYFVGVWVVQ